MSSLIVPICKIEQINIHPNADSLELAIVNGWQTSVRKEDNMFVGEMVVYFPPDTLMPLELANRLKVVTYLSISDRNFLGFGRVKSIKLRGEYSHGFPIKIRDVFSQMAECDILAMSDGDNVAELLGCLKYEPPEDMSTGGQCVREHPLSHRYTDIENMRHYPNVFAPDDVVCATEKADGTNSRLIYIVEEDEFMAGSHRTIKKRPEEGEADNLYWLPYKMYPQVIDMMKAINGSHMAKVVHVFGEIYGWVAPKLRYGARQGDHGYRVFDISVDGKYLPWVQVKKWCEEYKIDVVPEIYVGKFESIQKIAEFSKGKTVLKSIADGSDVDHIREGVVVKPYNEEMYDHRVGRKILKYVSDEYLAMKDKDRMKGH